MNTDTDRLNWLIENLADVEAPELEESSTWVIYTPKTQLGAGAGCSKDLRTAIDKAMFWKPEEKPQSSHVDELAVKSIAEKALKIANQNEINKEATKGQLSNGFGLSPHLTKEQKNEILDGTWP